MNVIGIDQSLTGTGVVILNEKYEVVHQELIETKPAEFKTDIERLMYIRDQIKYWSKGYVVDYGFMEGFAFGARGQALFQIAGLGYLIREYFFNEKIPLEIIAPKVLKKFVTGKGNSPKELMLLNVYKRWNISFEDNNICDAYSLARYGMEKINAKV